MTAISTISSKRQINRGGTYKKKNTDRMHTNLELSTET